MFGMPRRYSTRRLALASLIAALALACRLAPQPRTIDDAFITFRYARNLLAGEGFVYNPGERVLGTTTPLYTLLTATLAGTTGYTDYPRIAWLVNAFADVITSLLLIWLGQKVSGRRWVGLAAGALWAVAPMSVTFAVGGMETSVFILLLTLSAALYLAERARWAAFTSALMLLTRPDGAIFAGLLILDLLGRSWRARRLPWAEAAVFLVTLAPWALFATLYFGSPLPHSIAAKSLAYRLDSTEGLVRLIQHYSTPFFESDWLGRWWQLAGAVIYLLLCLAGGLAAFRRCSRSWMLIAYPWLYLIVFAAANPLIFRWYLAPPLPFYFISILAGVATLAASCSAPGRPVRSENPGKNVSLPSDSTRRRWPDLPSAAVAMASLIFLASSVGAWTLHPDHGPQAPAPQMAWHKLELLYTEVAQQLVRDGRVQAGTLVAAGDVGALGYYTGARILDTVGLMSPEASRYYPLNPELYTITYAVPPQLVLDRQPAYVVLLEVYGRKGLFKDPAFLSQYTLLSKIPTDIYGSDGLLVWQRR
jgi:hypothetical protein